MSFICRCRAAPASVSAGSLPRSGLRTISVAFHIRTFARSPSWVATTRDRARLRRVWRHGRRLILSAGSGRLMLLMPTWIEPRAAVRTGTDSCANSGPESAAPAADLARCFLRFANLPSYPLDRLSRYEAILWRQAGQILFALDALDRRKPYERGRRFHIGRRQDLPANGQNMLTCRADPTR